MAGEIGAGFGLDLSNLVAQASRADKKIMDMVEHTQLLNAELSKAVSSFQSMGTVKDLGAELKKFKGQSLDISLNVDTKPLEKVYGVIKDIIGSIGILTDANNKPELINTKSIYDAKSSVGEVKKELDAMYDSMIASLNEYNKLQMETFPRKDFEAKTFQYEEFKPVINPRTNEPYKDSSKTQQAARKEYEEKLALAKKAFEEEQALALKAHNAEQDRLQREFNAMKATRMAELKLNLENRIQEQAMLNEKLNWFKMTEDERAKYKKKTSEEILNAEIEAIQKSRAAYEKTVNEQIGVTQKIDKVGGMNLSVDESKSMTEALMKEYQRLDAERRELETRYGAYIVDIAKNAQDRIGQIEAERHKKTLEQESANMKSALEAKAAGAPREVNTNNSALDLINKIKQGLDEVSKMELGSKFNVGALERYSELLRQILGETVKLTSKSQEPVELYDNNALYTTNKSLAEVEAKYVKINQEISNAKFLITTLKEGGIPDIPQFDEFKDKDGKLIEAKREEFEMLKAFTIAEQELILKQDIEKRAIAKKELQWANMTEAERVAYVEKELQKELAAHKKHINEVRNEYRQATGVMVDVMRKSDSLQKANISADAIPIQAEYDRQYAEADSKRRALEKEYSEYLVDIANDTQRKILAIEQNRIKDRQEYDRKHITADAALKQVSSARTGFEMEEAKEAVKTALFNVDKDDVENIEKLNKAYIELRGNLEKLTRAQENEKTLQPTVRNEYSRLLKELDKVRKAKEKLEQTEVYKTAKDYKSIGRGAVLSQDEQAALDHYNKLQEYENQLAARKKTIAETTGELIKEVEIKHAAETSQARIDEITKEEARRLELTRQRLAAEQAERSKYGSISADSANAMVKRIGAEARNEQTGELNIKNIEQAKEAVNRLREARAHLDTTTEKGKAALASMNAEIEKHEHNIKMATDATYRKKQAEEEAWKKHTSSKEAAMEYADNAKSIKDMTKALSYLKEVRDNLEKGEGKAGAKKYAKDLDDINGKIRQLETGMKKAKGEAVNLGTTASQLTARLSQVFSVRALFNYAKGVAEVTGEFEKQRKAIRVLIGDQEQSASIWEKTVELAVNSPYEVKELVTYTKQLSAYRVEADKIFEKTKMLADVASGLGVDMNRLILAYGQVKAANYLRATELRQFSEAGVNMLKELSAYYEEIEGKAVSVAEVFSRISNRGVTFTDVDAVLTKITSVGGQFYKMQEEQSKTIGGMITNIKDSFSIMKDEIGRENSALIRAFLNGLKQIMNHWEIIGKIAVPVLTTIIAKTLLFNKLTGGVLKTAQMWGVAMKSVVVLFRRGTEVATRFAIANQMNPLNMWATIASVAFTAIMSIVGAITKYQAKLKEIRQEHEEFNESLSQIRMEFNFAGVNNDIDTQKEKLSELIAIANKEYNMKINISVKGLSAKEVADEFNNIEQMLKDAANFSANADESFIGAGTGQKMEKDLDQYSAAVKRLIKEMRKSFGDVSNISDDIFGSDFVEQVKKAKELILTVRDEKTESDEMVLQRQLKGFQMLKEISDKHAEQSSEVLTGPLKLLRGEAKRTQRIDNEKDLGFQYTDEDGVLMYTKLGSALNDYIDKQKEAYSEFYAFLDKESENLTHLEKDRQAEVVKSWIDTKADEERWGEVMRNQLYELANEQYKFTGEIEIKPNYVPPSKVELAAWQETYNELFKTYKGFSKIMQPETSQDDVIKRLDEEKKRITDIIARIKAAGGKVATEKGAYQGMDLDELESKLRDIEAQRDWFGAQDKKDQKEKDKAIKNYISLVKEMRSEYLNLKNTMDAASAEQKVMTSYAESFAEVFKDANISITDKIIDPTILDNLIKAGEVSDDVAEKLKELQSSGTYIRDFSDAGLEFTKNWEKFIQKAKALGDTRNGKKVWTYGYGETQGVKENDEISEEDASVLLKNRMATDYAKDLNAVLDKNKELVVTQEQYNALLDLTYQGGKGALERLIEYAKDNEKALAHVQSLHDKYVASGQTAKAEFFGKDFQDNLSATENIYQRLTILLNTMNLTVNGGQVKTINEKTGKAETWDGLLERSKARAAMFSMGEDVGSELSEIIAKSLTDFSSIDITTPEGIVEFFESLKPRARLAGEQSMIALTRAIAEYKTQIDLDGIKLNSINMANQVEEIFGNYQLSLEFSEFNVPKDMTEKLFNFEHVDLSQLKDGVIDVYSDINKYDELAKDVAGRFGSLFKNIDAKQFQQLIDIEGIDALSKMSTDDISMTDNEGTLFVVSPVLPNGEILDRASAEEYLTQAVNGVELDNVIKISTQEDKDSIQKIALDARDVLTAYSKDSGRLVEELNKDLSEIDWTLVGNLTSEEDMKKIKSYLEKVEDLELKHRRDIFKKYVEYSQAETTERAKIKLNELRTIADIEKTFEEMKKEDGADAAVLDAQKKAAKEKARLEAQKAEAKLDAEAILNSDSLGIALGGAGGASEKLIEASVTMLKKLRDELIALGDVEGAREASEKLNQLSEQMVQFKRPLQYLREAKSELLEFFAASADDAKWAEYATDVDAEGNKLGTKDGKEQFKWSSKEAEEMTTKDPKTGEAYKNANDQIAAYNAALTLELQLNEANIHAQEEKIAKIQEAQQIADGTIQLTEQEKQARQQTNEYIGQTKEQLQAAEGAAQKGLSTLQKQNGAIKTQQQDVKNIAKAQENFVKKLDNAKKLISTARGAFNDILDVLGESADSSFWGVMGNLAFDAADTVLNMIQLQAETFAATLAAEGFGAAMKTAMGPIGWIILAIELIVKAITSLFKLNAKNKAADIEVLTKKAEKLKEAFDKCVESIDKIASSHGFGDALESINKTYDAAAKKYDEAIDKADDSKKVKKANKLDEKAKKARAKGKNRKAARLERRAQKKKDSEEYKKYEELLDAKLELDEEYLEAKEELYSTATGGIFDDELSAARGFVDSWWDAFMETGDGLAGLEDNFNSFFADLVKQQITLKVMGKYIEDWNKLLDAAYGDDGNLTYEELLEVLTSAKSDLGEAAGQMSAVGEAFKEVFSSYTGEELSGLQKGIQGITEDQADILAAYWNQVRFDVSAMRKGLDEHAANMNRLLGSDSSSNPILAQLKSIEAHVGSIKSAINKAINTSGTEGYMKVKLI